jgi:selenocysteine lyase/cysteine desulfurase
MTKAAEQTIAGQTASVDEIRSHFPALERRHKDYAVAYLDGPGGTQVPRAVAEAMVDYLYHHNANTHWAYPTSEETDACILDARVAVADFLNASPDEIAFGANMTTLAFHLSRALGPRLNAGDEITTQAMKSSSQSWIITLTSRPGERLSESAAWCPEWSGCRRRRGNWSGTTSHGNSTLGQSFWP